MSAAGRKHEHTSANPDRVHATPTKRSTGTGALVLAVILLAVGWILWSYVASAGMTGLAHFITDAARSLR